MPYRTAALLFPGEAAISYFKQTFPQILELGKEGAYQNPAEWIVDITTKVRPLFPHVIFENPAKEGNRAKAGKLVVINQNLSLLGFEAEIVGSHLHNCGKRICFGCLYLVSSSAKQTAREV